MVRMPSSVRTCTPTTSPAIDDQCLGTGVRHHASGARCHGGAKALHEEAAGGIDALGFVPTRHRDGDFVKGIAVLAAAEEQTSVIG